MYSNFVFLDRFLFELSCKNTQTRKHTHTHRDSNEYSIWKTQLQQHNIVTSFKPHTTLRQILVHLKDKVEVKDENCDQVYIRETERKLETKEYVLDRLVEPLLEYHISRQ